MIDTRTFHHTHTYMYYLHAPDLGDTADLWGYALSGIASRAHTNQANDGIAPTVETPTGEVRFGINITIKKITRRILLKECNSGYVYVMSCRRSWNNNNPHVHILVMSTSRVGPSIQHELWVSSHTVGCAGEPTVKK